MVVPRLLIVVFLVLLAGYHPARAQTAPESPALAAAARILDHAKAEAAAGCTDPSDALVRVLCTKQLRVGLRTYYPGFSVRDEQGAFGGFEPDIGRRIAEFLGVAFVPIVVNPKDRIPILAGNQADLLISTMGDTTQRSMAVRFIRPHYYASQTAIVGHASSPVSDWADIAGRTVCLPLGSNSNIEFVRHHVRIMTFDNPEQLMDALRFDECAYIVQDDTFFARALAETAWAAHYAIKFRFAPLPWGMAVARENTTQFAALLDDLSAAYHADGTFLDLARAHRLDLAFLTSEQARWRDATCLDANGAPRERCLIPSVSDNQAADLSIVAPYVAALEQAATAWFGIGIDLSLFRNGTTFGLVLEGIGFTLSLVLGTQLSTLFFALGFSRLMTGGSDIVRRCVGFFTAVGQVTPLPLLLFFVYVLAGGVLHYSARVAWVAAVFAIGLYNGSNAARAIDEAHRTLVRPQATPDSGPPEGNTRSFFRAVSLASVQLVAFLINAAKGSPAAGMIGVPDFLNVVTDLTASSADRMTVYLILLVFYVGMVSLLIVLLTMLRRVLVRHTPGDG
jgi:ABC-type amino acid transport substrate-binding protein/ABC-type amino acid transport system permease subunit